MWSLGFLVKSVSVDGWLTEDDGLEGKAHSVILFLPAEFVKVLLLPTSQVYSWNLEQFGSLLGILIP